MLEEEYMESTIIEWLQTPSIGKGIVSFILLIALSFVPFMPIGLVYGAIAFAYPLWLAILINISGSTIGAIIMFLLCKYGLRGYYERKLKTLEMNSKFIQLMQTNGFLAVLIARFIPILPTAIVNIVSAMFQMPLKTYAWATLLGKLPAIFVYSLVGNQLLEQNVWVWLLLIVYIVIIAIAAKRLKGDWSV